MRTYENLSLTNGKNIWNECMQNSKKFNPLFEDGLWDIER